MNTLSTTEGSYKLYMKALSLKQPYAELILQGKKAIETGLWNTKFRGELLIHTSLSISIPTCKKFGFDVDKIIRGYIVGRAVFIDVKKCSTDEEYLRDSDKHLGSKEAF